MHAKKLLAEFIGTFALIFIGAGSAAAGGSGKAGDLAPVAVGLTLVFCILMGGPVTGASLNPARSLGPALFSTAPTALSSLWIYFVACPLGGILAAGVHGYLRSPE